MSDQAESIRGKLKLDMRAENWAAGVAMSYSGTASEKLLAFLFDEIREIADAPRIERVPPRLSKRRGRR